MAGGSLDLDEYCPLPKYYTKTDSDEADRKKPKNETRAISSRSLEDSIFPSENMYPLFTLIRSLRSLLSIELCLDLVSTNFSRLRNDREQHG